MSEKNNTKLNGYDLTRAWFNMTFERNDLKPVHSALFFWIMDLSNRLGWKKIFGLPTTVSMEAIGITSYNTYKKALQKLDDIGAIKIIEKSKNQYTSTKIALSINDKALYKALDEALYKADTKALYKALLVYINQETNEQRTNEQGGSPPKVSSLKILTYKPEVEKLKELFPDKEVEVEIEQMKDWLKANGKRKKDYLAFARNWLRKESYNKKTSQVSEKGKEPINPEAYKIFTDWIENTWYQKSEAAHQAIKLSPIAWNWLLEKYKGLQTMKPESAAYKVYSTGNELFQDNRLPSEKKMEWVYDDFMKVNYPDLKTAKLQVA